MHFAPVGTGEHRRAFPGRKRSENEGQFNRVAGVKLGFRRLPLKVILPNLSVASRHQAGKEIVRIVIALKLSRADGFFFGLVFGLHERMHFIARGADHNMQAAAHSLPRSGIGCCFGRPPRFLDGLKEHAAKFASHLRKALIGGFEDFVNALGLHFCLKIGILGVEPQVLEVALGNAHGIRARVIGTAD